MPHHSHASDTRYHAKSRLYRRRGTRWGQLSTIPESDPWLPSALLPYLSRSLRLSPMRIYLSDCKTSTHATSLSDGSSYTPSAYRSYCRNNDSSRTKHTDCCHNHYKPNRSYLHLNMVTIPMYHSHALLLAFNLTGMIHRFVLLLVTMCCYLHLCQFGMLSVD